MQELNQEELRSVQGGGILDIYRAAIRFIDSLGKPQL